MALPPASSAPQSSAAPAGIAALCATALALADLLERETNLIRGMHIREIGAFQAEKLRLTKLCGTVLTTIDQTAPLLPALKQRWQAASKRLGDAAIENEMALRVGSAATDKLVASIAAHIDGRRKAATGYARPVTPRRATMAGIAVDRRL